MIANAVPITPAPAPQSGLDRLRQFIAQFESALIAYSGGVDSALVMAAANQVLARRSLACIGVSPSYPQRELDAAVALAQRLGAPHRLVNTQEHLDVRYAENPVNRCYFCKSELYDRLSGIARREGFAVILDGTNASDLAADRPGYAAARERGVRSPLAELGIDKAAVRALARELDLPVWDKPSMPCLASRVPHGTMIMPGLLSRIERAEAALADLGFAEFRVRHHGDVARIELPLKDLPAAMERREQILAGVRRAGYRFVSLDLAGLSSGSLHAAGISPTQ